MGFLRQLVLPALAIFLVGVEFHLVLADGWHSPPLISSPLEFWRRNKERLGFSSGVDEGSVPSAKKKDLPEIDDLEAAEKKYAHLLKAAREESDATRKKALCEEIVVLREAITVYRIDAGLDKKMSDSGPKRSADQKKQAFVHQMIATMAYVNSDNISWAEFPVLMSNRIAWMNEIVQIMKEIGPEAAPQLYEHLRAELVLTKSGKTAIQQVNETIKDIQKNVDELRVKQRGVSDKATWEAVEGEIKKQLEKMALLQTAGNQMGPNSDGAQYGAPLPAYRGGPKSLASLLAKKNGLPGLLFDTVGFVASRDLIDLLTRSLLGIGPAGLKHWAQGISDPNPLVQRHVEGMIQKMGASAVPALADLFEEETLDGKKRTLAKALEWASGQPFGQDVARYRDWYEKNKPIPVKVEKGKVPDAPPIGPEQGEVKKPARVAPKQDDDEFVIEPRK